MSAALPSEKVRQASTLAPARSPNDHRGQRPSVDVDYLDEPGVETLALHR